ncbi:hypothetical protein ABWI00_20940 [Algihabitans albus]|uniref:hypothetical protein n=1 Tax=Algihabitans albus TaxID=2164067 RepID=UPI0035CF6201
MHLVEADHERRLLALLFSVSWLGGTVAAIPAELQRCLERSCSRDPKAVLLRLLQRRTPSYQGAAQETHVDATVGLLRVMQRLENRDVALQLQAIGIATAFDSAGLATLDTVHVGKQSLDASNAALQVAFQETDQDVIARFARKIGQNIWQAARPFGVGTGKRIVGPWGFRQGPAVPVVGARHCGSSR